MSPRMSVVIPVLDDAPALDRCLEALARQHVPPHEVIVVDNGSSDHSIAIARRHGARVLHEPVRGIGAAAARGYDAATGDLIGRLDADSIPPPDWIAAMTAVAVSSGADAVTGWGYFYDARWWYRWSASLYLACYYLLTTAAMAHAPLWGSSCVIRIEHWRRVSGEVHRWESEVHDDMDLSFALGPQVTVVVTRRPLVGVSARSVHGREQWLRRLARGRRTVALAWARTPPWLRWHARYARSAIE